MLTETEFRSVTAAEPYKTIWQNICIAQGRASMCWTPTPERVFDSSACLRSARDLFYDIFRVFPYACQVKEDTSSPTNSARKTYPDTNNSIYPNIHISGRQTGKTQKLLKEALKAYIDGYTVIIISANQRSAQHMVMSVKYILNCCSLPANIKIFPYKPPENGISRPTDSKWFWDDIDCIPFEDTKWHPDIYYTASKVVPIKRWKML